jgi:VIT1/CCC1 family predicted Fe2+/Mn2+ transporter
VASIIIGAVAALLLGGAIGAFTGRGIVRTARRQLTAAVVAAAVTYGVGRLLGTQTGG